MSSNHEKQRPPTSRRVFVSSTSRDLAAHRQQVHDTLLRLGLFPLAMEQFGARDADATTISTSEVAEAEVYLGIFAWRYGYIPPGETRSVTHLEYLEAQRLGRPCLLFLAHPDTERQDGPDALFPAAWRDPEHQHQLHAFLAEIQRERVVDYFTTPDDLAKRVAAALSGYLLKKREEELLKGPRPPHNLPPRPPAFVGRERELSALCATLLKRQSVGLAAAVAGMGGVGKSALAAEATHVLARDPAAFPGGITWVRCDDRRELPGLVWIYDRLLDDWNISLATEERGQTTSPEAEAELRERALRTRLRSLSGAGSPAPALALLDNIERELPLNRPLETLSALNVTLLLTSRAEPSSPYLRLVRLDVLESSAAYQLFREAYTRRGDTWDETRDGPAAKAAVQALGYLPLAIELAAARAARTQEGLAALAAEVQGPAVLSKLKDPLDPSASVRYSLNKSLALLTPIQRLRFAALGLPDGPDWPRSLVEHLLGAVPADAAGAESAEDDLDLLTALSLVKLQAPEAPANGAASPSVAAGLRVRLHPVLRELAREEWVRQPAQTQTTALAALLDGVNGLIQDYKKDFARLAREEALIAGTLRHAARERVAPEQLSAAIDALFDYLETGGHWRLGTELLTLQRNAQRDLGDQLGEGKTLNRLGTLDQALGRTEQASFVLEQALNLTRQVGDRKGEGRTLNNLGSLAERRGRKDDAQRYYQQALSIARAVQDRRNEGSALNNLGLLADGQNQKGAATRYYEQALVIQREIGDRRGEGRTLNNLGLLADSLGRKDEAADYYRQALAIRREVGDRAGEANTLGNRGLLADSLGHKDEAATCYQQALVIQREIGDRRGEGRTLNNLGLLADSQGKLEEAERLYQQSLAIAREVGDRRGEWRALTNLSLLAERIGRKDEATTFYQQALALWKEIDAGADKEATLIIPPPPGSWEERAQWATFAQPAAVIEGTEGERETVSPNPKAADHSPTPSPARYRENAPIPYSNPAPPPQKTPPARHQAYFGETAPVPQTPDPPQRLQAYFGETAPGQPFALYPPPPPAPIPAPYPQPAPAFSAYEAPPRPSPAPYLEPAPPAMAGAPLPAHYPDYGLSLTHGRRNVLISLLLLLLPLLIGLGVLLWFLLHR